MKISKRDDSKPRRNDVDEYLIVPLPRQAMEILRTVHALTLAGRPVECEDRPTKLEAVDLLKQLVFGVPNNLTKADKQIAEDAITVLVALLPDEQPGGFVN